MGDLALTKKQDVMKRNKEIAEFMNVEAEETLSGDIVYPIKTLSSTKINDIQTEWLGEHELLYHKSWDWLMPVVGKISNECEEPAELDGLKYALLTNNIEEAYNFIADYLST